MIMFRIMDKNCLKLSSISIQYTQGKGIKSPYALIHSINNMKKNS